MKKIFLALAMAMTFTVSYSAEPSNVEYTIEQKDGKVTGEEIANELIELLKKYENIVSKATEKDELWKASLAFSVEMKNLEEKYKKQMENLENKAKAGDKVSMEYVTKIANAYNRFEKAMTTATNRLKK